MSTQDATTIREGDELTPKEWRRIYIDQLGYATNFFLITASGLIGFSIQQLTNHQSLKFAIGLLLVSIFSGVACTLLRLNIFRRRRKEVHFQERNQVFVTFICQIGTFVLGIFGFAASTFSY